MRSPDVVPWTADGGHEPRGSSPYVFVVGCPRSGTTLLQRILDHHPALAVANDTHFIPRCLKSIQPQAIAAAMAGEPPPLTSDLVAAVKTYHRFGRLGVADEAVYAAAANCETYRDFVAALYAEYASMHGKRWAGEKTPDYLRHLRLLHGLFPSARFVHILRDGRDVALSLLEWARINKGPRRFALWYEEPVAACALWWRSLVLAAQQDAAAMEPLSYLEVHYERLVQQPVQSVEAICNFLDLPYADQMLSFFGAETKPSLRDRSAKSAWLPPTPGLRNWRTQLHQREQELFEALAGDLLDRLGYERITGGASPDVEQLADVSRRWWQANVERTEAHSTDRRRNAALVCDARHQPSIRRENTSLTPADAELAQRDPDLPGLALLLDQNSLARAVTEASWHVEIESAQCIYLRYKPGTSCLAAYEFQTAAGVLDGFAIAHRREEREKLAKILCQRTPSRRQNIAAVMFDDFSVVVAPPAYDRRLPSLEKLFSARGRSSLLRRVFAEHSVLHSASLRRLRYKPERRFVAQVVADDGPRAVLKLYPQAHYARVKRVAKALCSHRGLNVVSLTGRSDRYCALAFEWISATPLHDYLAQIPADATVMEQVGAALAELHARPSGKLPLRGRRQHSAMIRNAAASLGWLCPRLAREIDDCQSKMLSRGQRSRELWMTIHGDFHPGQVLLAAQDVKLIDLDRAARGHPAMDVGNFVAHLDRACLSGEVSKHLREEITDALITGYCRVASIEAAAAVPREVNLYRAAGLFQLAAEAFRLREPHWPLRIEQMLLRVAQLLESSPSERLDA